LAAAGTRGAQRDRSFPSLLEVLGLLVVVNALSLLVAMWLGPLVPVRVFVSYLTHVPQFVVPLVWYLVRLRPLLGGDEAGLFRWKRAGTTAFVVIGVILVSLNLLDEVVAGNGQTPEWARNGAVSVALTLVFQGLIVGFAEEMVVRVGVQMPLKRRWAGRGRFPWPILVAALAFGLMHLPNYFLGQPLGATVIQSGTAAVLGLVIGFYFQRSENYVGAALLHNLFNLAGAVGVLLVAHQLHGGNAP